MKVGPYSSVTAVLEHYAVLRAAKSSSAPMSESESASLAALEALFRELADNDRAALLNDATSGAAPRHRARAELNLRRVLVEHGALVG